MVFYYKIDESNVFWYSAESFEGSTPFDTSITNYSLPTTEATTAIRPYDDKVVIWDRPIPPMCAVRATQAMTIADMSGFQLPNSCTWDTISGGYAIPFNTRKFVFYRNCSGLDFDSGDDMFSGSLEQISSVEYGDDVMPDLPECTWLCRLFSGTRIRKIRFPSLPKCTTLGNSNVFGAGTFQGCSMLEEVTLPDMPSLETIGGYYSDSPYGAFRGCTNLRTIIWPATPNLTSMQGAFYQSGIERIILPDMPKLTTLQSAFVNCNNLESVKIGNCPELTTLHGVCSGCSNLETFEIGNTPKLNSIYLAFQNAYRLKSIELNSDAIVNCSGAFSGCSDLKEVILIGFSSITDSSSMFENCSHLTTINCSTAFDIANSSSMFLNCLDLVGGNGTVYDAQHTDGEYARIDGKDSLSGYFTYEVASEYFSVVAKTAPIAGSIKRNFPGNNYALNSEIVLEYKPNPNYAIDYWIVWNPDTKQFDRSGNTASISLTADRNQIAFAIPKYTGAGGGQFNIDLFSSNTDWGTVQGGGYYQAGSAVIISAIAKPGYVFDRWVEILSGQEINFSTSMNYVIFDLGRSYTLKAYFKEATEDPYGGDTSGTGGGGGTNTVIYDTSPIQPIRTDSLDSNFIALYRMTVPQIRNLAGYLWDDSWWASLSKYYQNPSDLMLSVGLMPVSAQGTLSRIKMGNVLMPEGVEGYKISNQYYTISCGARRIPALTNSFLDYNPHTSAEIYLPYIGSRNIDIDEIVGKYVTIQYNIDLVTGDCVAMIGIDGSVRYQFEGNMKASIPTGTASYNTLQMLAAGVSTLYGAATGNLLAFAGGVGGLLASAKENYSHSGSLSGNRGMLSTQTPCIYLKHPRKNMPSEYGKTLGFTSNFTAELSGIHGFTVIREIHLKNITAMTGEINEIETLLKQGVIL